MSKPWPIPPIWRVVAAFVVAPLPVAVAFAYWGMGTEPLGQAHRFAATVVLGLLFFAYPVILLVGIPAYLFLKSRLRPTALNCAGVGAVILVLPWLVLTLLATPASEFGGGHFTVEHGHRTLWGWLDLMQGIGTTAVMGGITGIIFWAVAAAGTRRSRSGPEKAF